MQIDDLEEGDYLLQFLKSAPGQLREMLAWWIFAILLILLTHMLQVIGEIARSF